MKALISFYAAVLGLLFICSIPCRAHNGQTAYAIPISGITIDGNLEEWPEDLKKYPIEWVNPSSREKLTPRRTGRFFGVLPYWL